MKISLIDYTENAKDLLIFSKRTRLTMSEGSFDDVCSLSEDEKEEQLNYVFTTIGSSWEFVDYTILIEGVTRAFTHQLVRHRVGVAFAQQAQRVVNMSGDSFQYLATGKCKEDGVYHQTMEGIKQNYSVLLQNGCDPQDARGVLPTNILTNILMKINLRALSSMCELRLCFRAQGEYQDVVKGIKKAVVDVHPFVDDLLYPCCIQHDYCPWPRFNECPIKDAFPHLRRSPDEIRNNMIRMYDHLGVLEFQPTGR